jgi:polysaccharide biosynthesis transport protein
MDIISFIKLLLRNKIPIVGFPILIAILAILATRNQQREYVSELSVYTGIASGVTIGSVDGASRLDMFNTNNQFDNFINILKSKETNEEVALRLLATNLSLPSPAPMYISKENYKQLEAAIPTDIHALIKGQSYEQVFQRLLHYKQASSDNFLVRLLASSDPHYSFSALAKIGIKRIGNSDIVTISYHNNDPGITYQTLRILSEVFIPKYKSLKLSQTDAVVRYFLRELDKVSAKLRDAEDRLLEFYKSNSVINYNEQTRYIAEQKEYMETDYVREKMSFASTKASVEQLENKINIRERLFLKNDSIVRLRNELYSLNLKKAENQLSLRDTLARTNGSTVKSRLFQQQINETTEQLNNEVKAAVSMQNSVEGITMEKILNSWLDYVVANEASRAKLKVMENRFKEFRDIYQKLAPVGATIKRIEREIDINEQQYLSILHGLNMAKLKLQDIEMSTNIKLLDTPYYPIKSLPSSRKLMVMAAFVGALLLIIIVIIALEYLDTSIRTAERAAKLTHLQVMGILPHRYSSKPWIDDIAQRLATILAQDVANHISNTPLNVGVISTTDGEGKSTTIEQLSAALVALGYETSHHLAKPNNIADSQHPEGQGCIRFFEFPSIILSPIAAEAAAKMGLFLLVVRANRKWNAADGRALNAFAETANVKPLVILNGVEEDGLEHYLGSLPKPRSRIRQWVKKMVSFNFFGRSNL